jgi:hypothetical protein
MLNLRLLLVVLAAITVSLTHGFPSGAPLDACSAMRPHHSGAQFLDYKYLYNGQQQPTGFLITAQPTGPSTYRGLNLHFLYFN